MTSLIYRQPGIIKQINQPSKQQQNHQNKSASSTNLSYSNLLIFPKSLPNIKFSLVKQLILNNNKLSQFQFDTQTFPLLINLSIQYNQLSKFTIRRSITTQNLIPNLQIINLSHNCMQFIDLSLCIKLNNLNLSYNKLSTVILNQTNLQQLHISHNMLSNIQYSVLGGRIFHKLKYLYINNNKRSLYDIILSINNIQLLPNLKQLDCSNNILSYLQNLPVKLQKLNLQENNFIFQRRSINQIIKLTNLQELRICGNMISQDYLNIMESKMRNKGLKIYYKKTGGIFKESPYRIYEDGIHMHDQQNDINHSNFTLGNQNQNIDPDYNLIQQTPRLFSRKQTQTQQKYKQQQQIQQSNDRTALKHAQNILKPQRYKLKIQSLRYHNHYKLYFQKLAQFMLIPPRPLLHAERSLNVSERIDPTDDQQFVNQFQLLNQMFKARGGVHYVRKIYNWQHTQRMKAQDIQIAFINMEMNQKMFNKFCDDDISQFQKAIKSRHVISQQPSSFSCYHILARLSMREPKWSCFYLIQAVHL